mmetsp:Transcript_16271/g.27772  ORF Transcript_16271/g.27772 Transcript_16271/m.27772 type:complete len:316 (+) Transcript_16271:114-1061(+)|eukprot:CAMPEP_0183750016 /NCGR_PEP_ID=MMETSP0739-20130205/750_1 /TAXON_ID=385413 /ORGANISM="Thalassiosira miniscula, Strain CCMP1093" /LENGTH=315 /DNA_ID=CAMNT_0025985929 /DNA_START=114 /DNA_END=1061 /DNA_ORIENTATION=+
MKSLPPAILTQKIAHYLSPADLFHVSTTSKKLHSQLALSVTPRRKIIAKLSRHDLQGYDIRAFHGPYLMEYGFAVPIPSTVECHSIRVLMSGRDQGWGNKKSYFVIAFSDNNVAVPTKQEQPQGPLVFSSGIAPHSRQHIEFIFQPENDRSYHLWYVVGGGGGHEFHLFNVTVESLIFDDALHSYSKACHFLASKNTLLPWDVVSSSKFSPLFSGSFETMLDTAIYSLEHGQPILPPMKSYFREAGLSEEDLSSLELMKSMRSISHDYANELDHYFNSHTNDNRIPSDDDETVDSTWTDSWIRAEKNDTNGFANG